MTAPRRSPRTLRTLLLAAAGLLACALAALLPAMDGGGNGGPGTAEAQGVSYATNLRLSGWTGCNSIRLTWTPTRVVVSGSPQWAIQKRVNNGDWTAAATALRPMNMGDVYWNLTGLNCTDKNEFRIRLGRQTSPSPNDSIWSDAVTAPSRPSQVAGLVFQSVNETRISVSWSTPPSYSTITGYTLNWRQNQGGTGDWTAVTGISASTASRTISGLTPGTAYEVRVAARTSAGMGAWSEILFARTSASIFANNPPDNVKIKELTSDDVSVNLSISWEAVTNATAYELERRVGDVLTSLVTGVVPGSTATDTHLEDSYIKKPNEAGELIYRVRARKGSGQSAQYTPWSPEYFYAFYSAGNVPVGSSELAAEIAGNRSLPADVRGVRDGVGGAVEQVFEPAGLQVDGDGIATALAVFPALALLIFGAAVGWQQGAPALGLGIGYLMFTMSLYAGNALLGLPIIWPMLATLVIVLVGVIAAASKLRRA